MGSEMCIRDRLSADSAAVGYALQALYSPDRSQVALLKNRAPRDEAGIYVLSLVDGTQRRLNTQPFVSLIGWSADGRTVYVLSQDGRGVSAVPVDGGSPTLLHTLPFEASWIGTSTKVSGLCSLRLVPPATCGESKTSIRAVELDRGGTQAVVAVGRRTENALRVEEHDHSSRRLR